MEKRYIKALLYIYLCPFGEGSSDLATRWRHIFRRTNVGKLNMKCTKGTAKYANNSTNTEVMIMVVGYFIENFSNFHETHSPKICYLY
jgi:hypothetical protein